MNIMLTTFLIILASIVASCGQGGQSAQIDEGQVEGAVYSSEEIGWTMEIPKGWDVIAKDKLEAITERGMDAVEEAMDEEFDYSGLKYLISFQKNQFNIFQSTSEPFKLEYEGEWEDNNAALKEIIYATFVDQGISADSTSTTVEIIDGLEFQTYSFTIYGPNGDVILNQIMYSRFINGFDFGVNLNYNNEKDKEEMMAVWKNSKFKKQ
ncbi:hypothetical protein FNH22_02270 [Fulvivirga sp. M361]|uniref:hypothetical protein n=1 Tax=Fulvivirga sp. M361 TaxID=2594266 RepID=UPI001193A950|nr:hypothetical protein [Fulvivirga sp. M361]TRX62167.1 hypothetical protein FNH22_02270 [Fulvivirga sp. M361]